MKVGYFVGVLSTSHYVRIHLFTRKCIGGRGGERGSGDGEEEEMGKRRRWGRGGDGEEEEIEKEDTHACTYLALVPLPLHQMCPNLGK